MASPDPKLIPEKIFLREYQILKGEIETPFGFDPGMIQQYQTQVHYEMSVDDEEQLMLAELVIEIETLSPGKGKEASGGYHFAFVYFIENFHDMIKMRKKGPKVYPQLAIAIASISYSTARGILLSRLQGTALRDFVLPVCRPTELLLPEDNPKAG